MVKLFLSGPGGCGKTTIVEALENHEEFKNFKRISEVARELMRERNLNSDDLQKYDIDQFISFQEYIIEQQCVAEERNITFENVISDRSALDCVAYVLWKTGCDFESRTFRELVSRNKVCITLCQVRRQLNWIGGGGRCRYKSRVKSRRAFVSYIAVSIGNEVFAKIVLCDRNAAENGDLEASFQNIFCGNAL